MRHAVFVPPFGELAEPAAMVGLAVAAEQAGWDAVFLWDHMWRPTPKPLGIADPWIVMAAIASATDRIRFGPMVTPLARRRPQKVARESVTLDRLSEGRLILGVGLGVDTGGELARFGEETDDRARADLLDEALDVLLALWSGEPVTHHGAQFDVDDVQFVPTPHQQPRIPVWVAARGGSRRPVRRAARYDGLFPVDVTLDQLQAMVDIVGEERGSLDGFDIAVQSDVASPDALAAVGATWCVTPFRVDEPEASAVAVVSAGPPS